MIADFQSGKYVEKTEKVEKVENNTEKIVEKIIEKPAKEEKESKQEKAAEPVVVVKQEPVVAQPSNYVYYDYRYYNNNAYPEGYPYCGPACRELEYEARRVPERHLNEIPTLRRPVKPIKPIPPRPKKASILPVAPVAVRDLPKTDVEKEEVVEVRDCNCKKANAKKIAAAVAITAVGCHLLHKIKK